MATEINDQTGIGSGQDDAAQETTAVEGELLEKGNYIAQVVSSHDGADGGFSFLGLVKQGYETVNTNGDVFVPQKLPIGAWVEFADLNSDPKRPGKFRTEHAKVIDQALAKPEITVLQRITRRKTYHLTAKDIDPKKVRQAAENLPFAEIVKFRVMAEQAGTEVKDVAALAQEFLAGTFANLETAGVSYSVNGDVNEDEEEKNVAKAKQTSEQLGMAGQVESIEEEYQKFKGIRRAFTLMNRNNILTMETVLDVKHLPDLLVAAPVWFVSAKEPLDDLTAVDDPLSDDAIKFFCDLVGSEQFAMLYQIYNRRTRPLSQFKGRDIIPLPLLKILESARQTFDYVVIATPYHKIASKEWADPDWLSNLDPFLIGFMKDLKYMFLLGRWSGTGLFPLMLDMIADTMDHLSLNKEKLGKFPANSYWYHKDSNEELLQPCATCNVNTVLITFAEKVLRAYDAGHLFDFLRGTWSEPESQELATQ